MWPRFARILERADTKQGDLSAAEFLQQAALAPEDEQLFRLVVEGFHAAPLHDISIVSLCNVSSQDADDNEQARVLGGYENLVNKLEENLPPKLTRIHLDSVAREVRVKARNVVTVRCDVAGSSTEFHARSALIAVPHSALREASGKPNLVFTPDISDYRRILEGIGAAQALKVILCFRAPFWDQHKFPDLEFLHTEELPFQTFWLTTPNAQHGFCQFTAWSAGTRAQSFLRLTPRELVAYALDTLVTVLGAAPQRAREVFAGGHCHDFDSDPFSLGAYCYLRPHAADAPKRLSEPIADTLFFAGEATDPDNFGTVAGAIASGERAARQIMKMSHA
jgi:monoamine oxidase